MHIPVESCANIHCFLCLTGDCVVYHSVLFVLEPINLEAKVPIPVTQSLQYGLRIQIPMPVLIQNKLEFEIMPMSSSTVTDKPNIYNLSILLNPLAALDIYICLF